MSRFGQEAIKRVWTALFLGGTCVFAAPPAVAQPTAASIHEGLLTLDTHLDTPANFSRPGWDIMDRHTPAERSQVDFPRMVEGGLKGGFFAVYTPQGPRTVEGDRAARDAAFVRIAEILEMTARHKDSFELALKADDAPAIMARGKRFVFISMENSAPIEGDLSLMSAFQRLGLRLIGPVHFKNNALADSATDTPEWHGLSPKGREFVAEANRLGLVLDASHASQETLDQMIATSKTPVILSHSGCKAVFDHPRNVDDARLKALAASGGVIQINALGAYLIPMPANPARQAALAALMAEASRAGDSAEVEKKFAQINTLYPEPRAKFEDYMRHMLHALKVAGVDHVGIGADMDGGGGVDGMADITGYPKITAALLAAGYGREDLAKIWGGNVLRVMRQAEAYRAGLKTASAAP